MQEYTALEWDHQFPHTDDQKEITRRQALFNERCDEFDKVTPGLVLYMIKNLMTKELHYKTATTATEATRLIGWDLSHCRFTPVDVGTIKTSMPLEVRAILKAKNEEKKEEKKKWIGGVEVVTKKRREGPTLKQEMLDIFKANPGAAKEQLLPKIYEVLKRRTGSEDEDHLKNRTNLSYYFYKRELEKM